MKFIAFALIIFLVNFLIFLNCEEEKTYNMLPSEDELLETTTLDDRKQDGDEEGDVVYGTPCFTVNASYAVSTNPSINSRQDIPVIPLPPYVPPTSIGPTIPSEFPNGQIPILPPAFPNLPQCCRNTYNHRRFWMVSNGFPSTTTPNQDCIYVIYRSSPNVCRVRLIFKYFLVDQDQFGCGNNFLEIDGQRICGCKTNFVYESQWGVQPKVGILIVFCVFKFF
jgi:hypothetical protein